MKLDKQDIHTMEQVGVYKSDPIYHIRTKGGFNIMALKKASGELKVLGTAAHRAVAKGMADKVQEGIQWHENLYKSEVKQLKKFDLNDPHASTPENHKAMANWHAHFAHYQNDLANEKTKNGQFAANEQLAHEYHKDRAIAHFKMAGMNDNQALDSFKAQHMYNKGQAPDGSTHFNEEAPFHSEKLANSFKALHNHIPYGHLGSRGLD